MSDKERQQETRKGKTPKKGNKKGKGKDSNNDTGSDEAGGSGERNVTEMEFMDLQAQQEEQHDKIESLQTDRSPAGPAPAPRGVSRIASR